MRVMIIPAAGRGSRLQFDGPKLLYCLDGQPLVNYLLARYKPFVDHFVLVIHPKMEHEIRSHMDQLHYDYSFDFQHVPTGMLDAITAPLERLKPQQIDEVWITWCDQVGITHQSAQTMQSHLKQTPEPSLVLPTIKKNEPYIHFERDPEGRIVGVKQRREGDSMPGVGENDCGLFGLSPQTYFSLLPEFAAALPDPVPGTGNQERNFLPFIPWLNGRATVKTYSAIHEVESIGINTKTDAQQILNLWQSL